MLSAPHCERPFGSQMLLPPSSSWLLSGVEPTAHVVSPVTLKNDVLYSFASTNILKQLQHKHDPKALLRQAVGVIEEVTKHWAKLSLVEQEEYDEIFHLINSRLQLYDDGEPSDSQPQPQPDLDKNGNDDEDWARV